jgi:hypothetical protein
VTTDQEHAWCNPGPAVTLHPSAQRPRRQTEVEGLDVGDQPVLARDQCEHVGPPHEQQGWSTVAARRGPSTEDGPENGVIASWLPNPATCGRVGHQAVIKLVRGRVAVGHDTVDGKHA